MANAGDLTHRRILVIDDNTAIHADFHKILGEGLRGEDALRDAKIALFGSSAASAAVLSFQIDTATQGQEGVALVRRAKDEQRNYAVAFIDMRMPPGWDGVETAARIWQCDPEVLVVICTAYFDYSWEEILDKLGRSHRLLILKKPFDNIEVLQLANALSENWRLTRVANARVQALEEQVAALTEQLQRAKSQQVITDHSETL